MTIAAIRYLKWLIPSVLILMIGWGTAVYISENRCILRNNRRLSEAVLRHIALNLNIRMEDQIASAKLMSDNAMIADACTSPESPDNIVYLKAYLKNIRNRHLFYEYIFIAILQPDSKNRVIAESSDISQSYPIQRFSDPKETVSNILYSPYSKLPIIIISSPIRKDSKTLGTVNLVIRLNEFSDAMIRDVETDHIGKVFFADADKVRDEKLSETYLLYKLDLFSGMTQEWYAGIIPNTDTISQESLSFLKTSVIAGIFLLIVWGIAAFIITHILFVKPIRKAAEISMRLADYDLSEESDTAPDAPKHDICQIMRSLKLMTDRFRDSMIKISEITLKLASSINDISGELNDQASIASEQSASVSQITATMAELSSSFTQIAEHSDIVAKIAERSLHNTKEGAESVRNVMAKMEDIHKDNQKNIAQIIELGKKSKEISKVMEIINTIADRTKLIAFNAALEASSAGEAGKRFGVVAMEIRRLADNVMESTDDIESNINEIRTAIENMIVSSEKSSLGIRQGLEYSTQTAAKLTDIVQGSQSTVDAAKQISLSTQQQKIAGEQVLIALREIDKSAEQGSLSIGHISSISRTLTELINQIQELIDKFILKK